MDTNAAIAAEQALYVRRNLVLSGPACVMAAWIIVIVFRDVTHATSLQIWAGLFSAAVCWLHVSLYRPRVIDASNAREWLRGIPARMLVTNSVLGCGAFILIPDQPLSQQITYLYIVFAMCASSMFCYGPHYPLLVATVIPLMVPLTITLLLQGSLLHWGLAGGQIILTALTLYFGRSFNLVFRRNLKLRFENLQLVSELTAQKEEAELANLSKSRFLASASHDLRQPMHALNLYLGALSSAEIPGSAKPLLTNAMECADAMDDMFRALLDVSSLDAGAVQPESVVFPIASVMERVRLSYTPTAQERRLVLKVMPCSAYVRSDPALVERILGNFVSNAVRYTDRGRILIGCRRRGDRLQVAVYDTGMGISANKQALIFEEFYQVSNEERDRKQGLGLGLAIVKRLAKLLGSDVSVKSQPGRGSVFSFELPQATPRSTTALREARPASGFDKLVGAFIVIVDDERMILNASRAVLERNGSFVFTAASGDEAISQLSHSRRVPDLIICDHRLRAGETGIEVIDAIREEFNKDIPAILITGDTAPERIRDMQASGIPILHKPIQEKELLSAMVELLPGNTLRRSIAA